MQSNYPKFFSLQRSEIWFLWFENWVRLFRFFACFSFFFFLSRFFSESEICTGSPETSCQSATTMNLFPTKENNVTPKNLTSMDFLSPQAGYRPHIPAEEIPTLINSRCVDFASLICCEVN